MTIEQSILCALVSNPTFVRYSPDRGFEIAEAAIKEATGQLVQIAESMAPKAEPKPKRETPLVTATDLEFYSRDIAYRGIDVIAEFHKFKPWCDANRKEPTKARFVNWLNRASDNAALRSQRPHVMLSPSVLRMSLERELKEAQDALAKLRNAGARAMAEPDYNDKLKAATDRVNDLRKRLNG